MTQKILRARRCAVRARLKHGDQIADLCDGEFHAIRKQIERRAERADDRRQLALRADPVGDQHWIILA